MRFTLSFASIAIVGFSTVSALVPVDPGGNFHPTGPGTLDVPSSLVSPKSVAYNDLSMGEQLYWTIKACRKVFDSLSPPKGCHPFSVPDIVAEWGMGPNISSFYPPMRFLYFTTSHYGSASVCPI